MLTQFFKRLFKAGKQAKITIEDSVDFIDDVLEKEYITGSIDKVKQASGQVVESAGMVYQKSKDNLEGMIDTEKIKSGFNKIKEKGKELSSELAENMSESSETLKNVMNEGKDILDKFFDEEE